jgi:hypothetical protein
MVYLLSFRLRERNNVQGHIIIETKTRLLDAIKFPNGSLMIFSGSTTATHACLADDELSQTSHRGADSRTTLENATIDDRGERRR